MNKKFAEAIEIHESEDTLMIESEEKIFKKIRSEFKNIDEIIEFAKENPFSAKDFFRGEGEPLRWPVLPVRTAKTFGIRKHTTAQRPYYHDHDFYELIYVHRGSCKQFFLNPQTELILGCNTVCLLRPGAVHAIDSCKNEDLFLKIIIPPELYETRIARYLQWESDEKSKVFETSEQVEYFIFKILEEQVAHTSHFMDATENYLQLLLIELLREPKLIDAVLQKQLTDYLQSNIKTATLQNFSDYLGGYNKSYVGRMIKEKLKESFSDILGQTRLKKSILLLESTDLSVENVAYEIGYANASGFYKKFCAFYGMTPSAYRKMFR